MFADEWGNKVFIESYPQQYDRMKRFLRRIADQNRDQMDYIDDMWSFFMHCYHLKDWIKNDPQTKSGVGHKVEDKITDSAPLRMVADLANRVKHFCLKPNMIKGNNANMASIGVTMMPLSLTLESEETDPASCTVKYRVIIKTDRGDKIDGLQLAEDAVKEWDKILKDLDL